jgi:hypothetical protein
MGPMGPAGFRRRGRRRGLVVGAAVGAAAANRRNQQSDDNSAAAVNNGDQLDPYVELEKLAKLKDEGIVTEAEFQAKKKELLNL